MTIIIKAAAAAVPKNIVNAFSSGGVISLQSNQLVGASAPGKVILSGALAANVLKTIINISGAGAIKFLSALTAGAVNKTVRLRLTIDGVIVFDTTSSSTSSSGCGLIAVGNCVGSTFSAAYDSIPFNSSMLVEVASNNTETDTISTTVAYQTN